MKIFYGRLLKMDTKIVDENMKEQQSSSQIEKQEVTDFVMPDNFSNKKTKVITLELNFLF